MLNILDISSTLISRVLAVSFFCIEDAGYAECSHINSISNIIFNAEYAGYILNIVNVSSTLIST